MSEVGRTSVRVSCRMLRAQVKAPKTCCPAPGGAPSCCRGGGGGVAAGGAPAQMDDGGTQQINMVGFTTKGMGYIQYRGWHHSWDGGHPGPVATRSYHNHEVNQRYDYGATASPSSSTAMLRHRDHRRTRGREQRRIADLKTRLSKDDGEIASLKNEVRLAPVVCVRVCVLCVCVRACVRACMHACVRACVGVCVCLPPLEGAFIVDYWCECVSVSGAGSGSVYVSLSLSLALSLSPVRVSPIEKYKIKLDEKTNKYVSEL